MRHSPYTRLSPTLPCAASPSLSLSHQGHQLERWLVGERQDVLGGLLLFSYQIRPSSLVRDALVIKGSSCPLRKTVIQVSSYRSRPSWAYGNRQTKFGTISQLGATMVRQNRAAMTVKKLRRYIFLRVLWNSMYREELKRNL